jgi:hypothetical protein
MHSQQLLLLLMLLFPQGRLLCVAAAARVPAYVLERVRAAAAGRHSPGGGG